MIDPKPQVPVSEQVVAKQRHQIGQGPLVAGLVLQILQNEDRDQCCPNLDLPAVLVDGRDRRCSKRQMVGQQDDDPVVLLIENLCRLNRPGYIYRGLQLLRVR